MKNIKGFKKNEEDLKKRKELISPPDHTTSKKAIREFDRRSDLCYEDIIELE
jgi:hypothetical protein